MGTRTAARFAGRSSSPSPKNLRPTLTTPPAAPTATALRLSPARTGDHVNIHRLLVSVFHGPSTAEFHAQLDEPGYQPADRVVVRDGNEVVAHLRLAPQTIAFEGLRLSAARFMDLATAPEYQGRGLATALLTAAERAAAERRVLVGLTRTRAPRLFARLGWTLCGRHVFSAAAPRAILAEISAAMDSSRVNVSTLPFHSSEKGRPPTIIRPLRRVDLPAIVRLYKDESCRHRGWPDRSESFWEWILARGACDQVYVAATFPEPDDLAKAVDSIVGYAFVRQCRIVEMVSAPDREDVDRQLLERVCADASEQGGWLVRADLPPEHRLHDTFRRAGGEFTNLREVSGEVFMTKLLDPLAVLRTLAPRLYARARQASLPRAAELGIDLRGGGSQQVSGIVERYRLCLGKGSLKVVTGGPSRHRIALRYQDLAALLLGDCGSEDLLVQGKLKANCRQARQIAAALLPPSTLWRPPFDDLLV